MIGSIGSSGSQSWASQAAGMFRPPKPDFAKMFGKIDSNGDGSIDKTELSQILQSGGASSDAASVDTLFSALGGTSSSGISKDSFTSAMQNVLQQLQSQAASGSAGTPGAGPVADADGDNDGSVAGSQATGASSGAAATSSSSGQGIDKLFAKLDSNGDGSISQDELKAGLQAMRQHGHHGHHHHAQGSGQGGDMSANFIASVLQQYQASAGLSSNASAASTVSTSA